MNSFHFNRTYRGPLQAVILDWAGTTLDYGCMAPAAVFLEVFRKKGVEISIEEARIPMGAHKKVHIRQISQLSSVAKRWQQVHNKACTEEDVDAMFHDFVPLQLACIASHAELIPGTLDTIERFCARGLKIGSTTGYTAEMMEILQQEATKRGYTPHSTVCASEVPEGRPAPWMCFQNARNLQIYPMQAIVKIGDTLPDIEEGLNAGMWTIGLAKTGNEMGLTEKEIKMLTPFELQQRLGKAYGRMRQAGAHYVVDGIWDVNPIIDEINRRLARGETP